jgi:hypothetical protein
MRIELTCQVSLNRINLGRNEAVSQDRQNQDRQDQDRQNQDQCQVLAYAAGAISSAGAPSALSARMRWPTRMT